MGVARGLLQERPLQNQHGNACVKSWQPMSNSWSTSSQPDFVRALGRTKTARIAQARFCTQSCSKVGQLLVNSSPTPHPMGSCRGLPCSSPLATPEQSRNIYRNSVLKYTEGGDKTSQHSYLGVILANWVPDSWVYQLPNYLYRPNGRGGFGSQTAADSPRQPPENP